MIYRTVTTRHPRATAAAGIPNLITLCAVANFFKPHLHHFNTPAELGWVQRVLDKISL